MALTTRSNLHPLNVDAEKPLRFNNPFDYEPHPLCTAAADEVMRYVNADPVLRADAERGKMFGVMVVENPQSEKLFFLAAYSGLLAGRNDWQFFVPPVFDAQQPDGHFKTTERLISAINSEVKALNDSDSIAELKRRRKQMSEELQLWLFHQYVMLNARGEEKDLVDIWRDYHSSPKLQAKFPLPPGGSGDCCAPKLLQYAYRNKLHPVAIAEFWFGQSPRGEVRHHGHYYPACRGKCLPILTFMLQGLEVDKETYAIDRASTCLEPEIVYQDSTIIVVAKPSGMLSVPGRINAPSLEEMLTKSFGRVFMPHRLDMDTSGLMVVARNEDAYKNLQQQFYSRTIYKRYEALVDGELPVGKRGTIDLPLRPDPLDRPRQVVDPVHGKAAVTDYEVLASQAKTLVSLMPHTGRTHQLRVHCAHADGLGMPIIGDTLYGTKAHRLCLHAAELAFDHPDTGERMHFSFKPDFFPTTE